MRRILSCISAVCALVTAGGTFAQSAAVSYPNKPLRLVVGFPAGGPADILGRAIAQKLTEVTGRQVVVDKLRALAIATSKRAPTLPDVPTMAEAGYPSVNADNWYGIVVAAATPEDIVAKLYTSLLAALRAPETKQRLESQGADAMSSSPEALAAFMRDETIKWGKVIKTSGIKLDAM